MRTSLAAAAHPVRPRRYTITVTTSPAEATATLTRAAGWRRWTRNHEPKYTARFDQKSDQIETPASAGINTTWGPIMPTGIYDRPPIVADRLRWLGAPIDDFRTWLEQRGNRAATIVEIIRLLSRCAHFGDCER